MAGNNTHPQVKSRHFLRLDKSLLNYQGKRVPFSSNLPLVVIGTYGRNIDSVREPQPVYAVTLLPGAKGKTSITARPEYEGRSAMHQRGETSAQLDQSSYAWETVGEKGDDKALLTGVTREGPPTDPAHPWNRVR